MRYPDASDHFTLLLSFEKVALHGPTKSSLVSETERGGAALILIVAQVFPEPRTIRQNDGM
jgi:hypothetical protein